jgi:tetratricopeptide (TPR) repeat protein
MRFTICVSSRVAIAVALFAVAAGAFADALTDRARRLISERQHQAAYNLLLPQEGARAGDPEFDYLLGISALDSGDLERAVFALERVLAVQPNNHVARAEIARAYFAMGEKDTARREFETVRQQTIPAEAKATIEKYLSAIAASDVTQITGYVELGVGYDSNVNSATGNGQIALPVLGGLVFSLNPNSVRRSDTFASLSGGANMTHRLSPEWAIVGGAAAAAKLNKHANEFDTLSVDANLGARWSREKEAITVGAQFQTFELDWGTFRDTKGLIAQWQHSFDERRQATLFTQYSELRYPGQDIRNANRKIVGAAYAHAFDGDAAPVFFGSVYGGREDELAEGVPQLGHVPVGVRAGGQLRLAAGLSAFANASYEHRKYGGTDPIFLVTRTDRQSDVGGGLSYILRPGTTLIGQVSHTSNKSNIQLNEFRRTLVTTSVRFNF